jgi:hypothetical protein
MRSALYNRDMIKEAVINDGAQFSSRELQILRSLVEGQFTESRRIGHFTVYWRQ